MNRLYSFIIHKVRIPPKVRKLIPKKIGMKLKILKDKIFEKVISEEGSTYNKIELSEEQIKKGDYMKHLGGESLEWDYRGKFELDLMKKIGLKKTDSLLDYGCGPLRAGRYFIDFLNKNNYFGADYNPSFIKAGEYIVKNDKKLAIKNPNLNFIPDFDFDKIKKKFDYILLFSVLNHCTIDQRKKFFREVVKSMDKETRIVITHSRWFNKSYLDNSNLKIEKFYSKLSEIESLLNKKIEWAGEDGLDPPEFTLPIFIIKKIN